MLLKRKVAVSKVLANVLIHSPHLNVQRYDGKQPSADGPLAALIESRNDLKKV